MSDVRIQLRFRNDLLQRLVDESESPIYKIVELCKVDLSTFHGLKSLQRSPFLGSDEYSNGAKRIAEFFSLPPEVLFPPELYRVKFPSKIEKAFPVEKIACLLESDEQKRRALPPHENYEEIEKKEILSKMLDTLTPRERRIIELRFGLSGENSHTLEEIGADFEVTRDRIRQIEARALRKLRHPSNSRLLRQFI